MQMRLRATVPSIISAALRQALPRPLSPLAAEALERAIVPAPSTSSPAYDYQVNVAAQLSRVEQRPAAELARSLAAALSAAPPPALARVAVSGPSATSPRSQSEGFINFGLSDAWLLRTATNWSAPSASAPACAAAIAPPVLKILVDFASPNVGKELHVGHLRSAVVGDSIARILELEGGACVEVTRVSHVGDLGLPAALVLAQQADDDVGSGGSGGSGDSLPTPAALSLVYERAKRRSATDAAFSRRSQALLRQLQQALAAAGANWARCEGSSFPAPSRTGAPPQLDLRCPAITALGPDSSRLLARWVRLCDASRAGYAPLLRRLGANPTERPESAYAPLLQGVVAELLALGAAVEDDGAVAVFVDGRKRPPLLVRKRDGGYLYATVDLACLRMRLAAGFDRIVYLTDSAQAAHFRMLFAAAHLAGWVDAQGRNLLGPSGELEGACSECGPPAVVRLEHAAFGVITGEGGRKLSSRDGSGAELTLAGLLDGGAAEALRIMGSQAEERLQRLAEAPPGVQQTMPLQLPLSEPTARRVAERVSSGAIRFFDLVHRRPSPYGFSFERALALKGASAAYLLYATTRLGTLRRQAAAALAVSFADGDGDGHEADYAEAVVTEEESARLGDEGSARLAARTSAADVARSRWEALASACDFRGRALLSSPSPALIPVLEHWPEPPLVPLERALALAIVRTPEAIQSAARLLMPHVVAEHALELAQRTHACYDGCRVLPAAGLDGSTAVDWALAARRLRLLGAADADLRACLWALGVRPVARM